MGKEENTKVMWHEVYPKLALELNKLDDEEKRRGFFKKCINNEEFVTLHSWAKNFFDKSNIKAEVSTFDPLQIFASFNGFGMSDSVRTEKINLYFKILDSEINQNKYENIDFSGCPTPMILHLVAIRTRKDWGKDAYVDPKKEEEAQGKIWKAFKQVINPVIKPDYSSIDFEDLKTVFGVTLNSFSLLLFWIDSENFLPLDKNTLALFETNNQNKVKSIQKWDEYLEFLTLKNTDIYQIITSMAWEGCSYETLNPKTKDLLTNQFGIKKCPQKSLKIIAIKPLKDCNPSFLKGLKENQIYLFDKAYSIDDNGNITYHKEKDIQLFNQDDLHVNINAIVGKNGTGKSTLVELLLAIINNVTYKQQNKDCIKYIENLKVEFIFEDLHIYKVKVKNEEIKLFEYTDDNDWKEITNLNSKHFFYNILVNYSIHSLSDDWIEPHFQNDCHTDIMIEPLRKKGSIDILEEEDRVKERLIVNLLEPESNEEDEYSFKRLTDTYKAIELVSIKNRKTYPADKTENGLNYYKIENVSKIIQEKRSNNKHLAKLRKFKFTSDSKLTLRDFEYQRIEFFKNSNEKEKRRNKTIEQVIPKNLFIDILLENNIKFSQLSSGEKQKIYSINSIVYHIKEIDRKKKYKHINLILDEIELYFHPELQRTYISDVIKAIKKVGTENILGINITFITHSPFILSDIPESKILFLEKDSDGLTVPKNIKDNTFGANIHTLLSDSFFMENGLIGEFAKQRINKILKNLQDDEYKPNEQEKNQLLLIIESIGEPFLRSKMLDMYNRKFIDDYKDREKKRIEEQINDLNKKLKKLDND